MKKINKEVIDALSQSKIKSAVTGQPAEQYPQQAYPQTPEQQYPQQTQQYDYSQQYAQPYVQPQYSDSETIRETAEEVAEEKVAELREKIGNTEQMKKDFELRIQDLDRRLKSIEGSLDKLQIAILGKISEYSKDLANVTSEMKATQEVFKKVINPIVDKVREKAEKKKK